MVLFTRTRAHSLRSYRAVRRGQTDDDEAMANLSSALQAEYAGVFGERPFLAARFSHSGRALPALIDTGAHMSVFHEAWLKEMAHPPELVEDSVTFAVGPAVRVRKGRVPVWLGSLANREPRELEVAFVADWNYGYGVIGWQGYLELFSRLGVRRKPSRCWPFPMKDHSVEFNAADVARGRGWLGLFLVG